MDNTTKIILGSLSLGLFVGSSRGSTNRHYFFVEKYKSQMRPWIVTETKRNFEIQSFDLNSSSPDCLIPIKNNLVLEMIAHPESKILYNGIDGSITIQVDKLIETIFVDCGPSTDHTEIFMNMLLSVKQAENKLQRWNRKEIFTGIPNSPKFILEVIDGKYSI